MHPTTNCTSTPHAPSSLLSETPLKVLIGAGSKCQLTEEYAHANIHQSSLRVEVLLRRGYCARLLELFISVARSWIFGMKLGLSFSNSGMEVEWAGVSICGGETSISPT